MIEIKHRYEGVVLYTGDTDSTRAAVVAAVAARANLSEADLHGVDLRAANLHEADLSGADLRWAHLRGANLRGADLRWANLRGADLSGAHLSGANLRWADLRGADLSGADLSGANLRGADLSGAHLSGADLRGADLSGANLSWADLSGADLSGAHLSGADLRELLDSLPAIENLDAAILSAVEASQEAGKAGLNMSTWHTCGSTHCIAGWAIHLSGRAGYALEDKYGPATAGALIYYRNGAERIPNFYAHYEEALEALRERAGVA